MITFIFILIVVVLIILVVQIIKGNEFSKMKYQSLTSEEKGSLVSKKTLPVANIGLILIFVGTLFINYSGFYDEKQNSIQPIEISPVSEKIVEKTLTPQMKFLKDNGFNENAEFTDSQFQEFKKTIESGLFKKETFCEVYQKGLKLQGAELDKYLKKFKKIDYFETLLFMYGPKVCNSKPIINEEFTSISSYTNSEEDVNPCIISEDFIKQDLRHPSTADFSSFDCSTTKNDDGTYTILRKVSAQNSFGVESSYIYKVQLGFKGGNRVDMSNWDLINIRSEEFR